MIRFKTILGFELGNFLKNRVFVGVTLFFVAAIAIALSFPRITALFKSDEAEDPGDRPVMMVSADVPELQAAVIPMFSEAFPNYEVKAAEGDVADAGKAGAAECGFSVEGLTAYKYYVKNVSMYDSNEAIVKSVLT